MVRWFVLPSSCYHLHSWYMTFPPAGLGFGTGCGSCGSCCCCCRCCSSCYCCRFCCCCPAYLLTGFPSRFKLLISLFSLVRSCLWLLAGLLLLLLLLQKLLLSFLFFFSFWTQLAGKDWLWTDRQTDRQTDRHIHLHTARLQQTGKQVQQSFSRSFGKLVKQLARCCASYWLNWYVDIARKLHQGLQKNLLVRQTAPELQILLAIPARSLLRINI